MTRIFLGLVLFTSIAFGQSVSDVSEIDFLSGEEKVKAIKIYLDEHKADTAQGLIQLAEQGMALAKELGLDSDLLILERLIGTLHLSRGELDTAKKWLEKAKKKAKKQKNHDELHEMEGVLGKVFYNQGHMEGAIENWLPTLKYLEQKERFYRLGIRQTQLGNAYLMLGETKTGIKYNRSALTHDTIQNTEVMMAKIYNSLGYAYDELKDYDSAIFCYNQAYDLGKKSNNQYRMGMSRINICSALESQNKFDDAKECLTETIAFLKANGMKPYLVNVYTTLLNLQLNTDQNDAALRTIDSIKFYIKTYPAEHIRLQIPKMEYMAFQAKGNYKAALERFKKYTSLSDSAKAASKLLELEEMRLTFETEKKNQELKAAKRENILKDQRNTKTRFLWISSSVILLLILGLVLVVGNRRQIKRKREIAENKVANQVAVLKATIDGQEQERKRIAQELHDGIGQQFTAIKMAYEVLADKVDEKTEKMSNLIEHAAQDVRNLSHRMMPKVLQDIGLNAALSDLVEALQNKGNVKLSYTTRNMDIRLGETEEINLYRIAQELLNNALKHAQASEINLMLYKADGKVILLVSDNGVGTKLDGREGHGFMNINSRAETIGAEYFIETSLGEGFTFTLKLPITST